MNISKACIHGERGRCGLSISCNSKKHNFSDCCLANLRRGLIGEGALRVAATVVRLHHCE